jgi:ribosomal protein S18 acetylase RimI-like enzyme
VGSSLRSFGREDGPAVLELSRRALMREQEHVGNPLWATQDELDSELDGWDEPPEATLLVDEDDGRVVAFGGVEIAAGFPHADLFGPLVVPDFRGQKLGSELVDASVAISVEHGRHSVIGAVGPQNITGRLLLERKGFHRRGNAKAVFRLVAEEHRPVEQGPPGVEVRPGTAADLDSALHLYHETFPEGVFPDEGWREGLAAGSVSFAERDGVPIAFLSIDPSDRWAYQLGVEASERSRGVGRYLLSRVLDAYWSKHPGETLGLSVDADNVPVLRLLRRQGFAPWLVLQSYELWV